MIKTILEIKMIIIKINKTLKLIDINRIFKHKILINFISNQNQAKCSLNGIRTGKTQIITTKLNQY